MGKYRYTFLTRTRFSKLIVLDNGWADRSIFQIRLNKLEGTYELSLLGIINGILSFLHLPVLVAIIDDYSYEIQGYKFKKKWW